MWSENRTDGGCGSLLKPHDERFQFKIEKDFQRVRTLQQMDSLPRVKKQLRDLICLVVACIVTWQGWDIIGKIQAGVE